MISGPSANAPSRATLLAERAAVVDDLTELRDMFIALLEKLDADSGVDDTDYADTLTPAALSAKK